MFVIPASILFVAAALAGGCGEHENALLPSGPVLPVTFAVFGNTGEAADGGAAFSRLADEINAAEVEFVIDTGNRLTPGIGIDELDGAWASAQALADSFHAPLYPVAGDRDVFDASSDAAYSERFGPRWYSFQRNGVMFVVIDTGDGAHRSGFGVRARFGTDQIAWLNDLMGRIDPAAPLAVFMHRPLWKTDPSLWRDTILPLLRQGGADLVATSCKEGLADWGTVDGIRAVSTGCVAPTDAIGAGRFPHALLLTITKNGIAVGTLTPDGVHTDGIPIDTRFNQSIDRLRDTFTMPVLEADASWNVGETLHLRIANTFTDTLACRLDFSLFAGTSWRIEPSSFGETIAPGAERTINIRIEAAAPELGPAPEYSAEVTLGGRRVVQVEESLRVRIPRQRTGVTVPIAIETAGVIPYDFDGGTLRIPVEVRYPDTCGRLIICSDEPEGAGRCLYISPLADFRPGLNEFTWNGRDTAGNIVRGGNLTYHVAAYNKEGPPTWVADGPPDPYGMFTVERSASGLRAYTHSDSSLTYYQIGKSGEPEPATVIRLEHLLNGAGLRDVAYGKDGALYLLTDYGILGVTVRNAETAPIATFGNGGYRVLPEYRGREFGGVSCADGRLYLGVGGSKDGAPLVAVLHPRTGERITEYPLDDFYGGLTEAPSINAAESGILISHPVSDLIVCLEPDGALRWVGETGNWVVGADADGRSFAYHPGGDRFGFVYANTFGYSARCGVLGPDGSGLFRVILTQLPGLRTGDIVPMIEGNETDGLYFVTRGGDRPYVFHIPYTIGTGVIVDQTLSPPPEVLPDSPASDPSALDE